MTSPRLDDDYLLDLGCPAGLLDQANSFLATLHLCHPQFCDPDAVVILQEILDDPLAVLIDGSTFNHRPELDETIINFVAAVLMRGEGSNL